MLGVHRRDRLRFKDADVRAELFELQLRLVAGEFGTGLLLRDAVFNLRALGFDLKALQLDREFALLVGVGVQLRLAFGLGLGELGLTLRADALRPGAFDLRLVFGLLLRLLLRGLRLRSVPAAA